MKNKQKLLAAILTHIPQQGWTERALTYGAKSSKISLTEARKIFPQGIIDVIVAFQESINDAMMQRINAKRNFAAMRIRDKITFAVRARLEALEQQQTIVQHLLTWSLLPQNITTSARMIWEASDLIWNAAGDTSKDYNHYTKRLLLIAVMKSTLFFWLNDTSRDRAETWDFLDRRIENVMTVGKGLSVIKTVGITDIISFVRSHLAA